MRQATVCGHLISGDEARPCVLKPGHKDANHRDAAYLEQRREYQRRYHEENREQRLERMHQYCEENREQKREYDRKYREENREQLLEQDRERKRKRREENREQVLERERKYREENRERLAEYSRKRHEANYAPAPAQYPPDHPGWIYFLLSDDELLYVGQTIRPEKRLYEHKREQPWGDLITRVEMLPMPYNGLNRAETVLIHRYHPYGNALCRACEGSRIGNDAVRDQPWTISVPGAS